MRGTSFWQWGHQWATTKISFGLPSAAIVIGLPSRVLTPLISGTDWPTAGSEPLSGLTASAAPFTVTGP